MDKIKEIEALVTRFFQEHKDWYDEDEFFDLSVEISELFCPDPNMDEDERGELDIVAGEAFEWLTPRNSSPQKIRRAAERCVADVQMFLKADVNSAK